ncbi:MAG: hypothetical protein JWL59_3743 [Chthoniobacteraceae bacterium]|nr:hypothetical protein [Chthoniobacteraceae bacterium]
MKFPALFIPSTLLWAFSCIAADEPVKPLYSNDFESAEVEKVPQEFMVMSGSFVVKEEAGNKFLELPGSPLDTFGLLFGPTTKEEVSATGRFFGTKQGRKFPAFGISLNGVGGYRLQVSAAKKTLEIFKGDEAKSSVNFEWTSGAWTKLRVQVRKTAAGTFLVEGKAWNAEGQEPATWQISFEDKEESAPGRAGIWGSPYSGTPIRFDDISVTPLAASKN